MNKHNLIAAMVLCISLDSILIADIAPTTFAGFGIKPIEDCNIRLVTAKVNIVWGIPCSLSAVFELRNEDTNEIEINLGFPFAIPDSLNDSIVEKFLTDCSITFDGEPEILTRRIVTENTSKYSKTTWIQCRHNFTPGTTIVAVKSKFPASLVSSWPGRENIYYYIHTGGLWKGRIAEEQVTINFPSPVSRQQIIEITPSNYEIKGNSVQWRFENFEPNDKHDISFQYMRPDIIEKLSDLRDKLSKDPNNPALIIKLAKHLFVLGTFKGYAGYPPDILSKEEFNDILGKIQDKKKKALFKSRYHLSKDDEYREIRSEWTEGRIQMVDILSEIDYQPAYCKSSYVTEAKGLLEKILKDHPANAEAWNVYLANYYRFRFAGTSPDSQQPVVYEHQKSIILNAHKNCPSDPCIKLWLERCKPDEKTNDVDSDSNIGLTPLIELLKKNGIYDVEYADVNYGYY
jgi:hypothetical protein